VLANFPVNLQGNVNLLPKFARNLLGNLPGNSSVNLSREFTKGNLLGKFSVIFVVHYLGICQAICHGNLLREFARKFSEILAGNLLVNSLGPLVLITAYYCLLVLIWHDRILPAFYLFIPAKPVLCIPPFCPPWLPGASSAK
jgi:hypothetical protein